MATRIRLQRQGKKGRPYYHIVVADQRSPRDGKYIERIGAYDPNHDPAFIEVDIDKALDWMQKGAQPSETCRAILSYRGVLYKNHLMNGVGKGAFDEAEADRRFDIWINEKNAKIDAKRKGIEGAELEALNTRLADEAKKAEKMASDLSAKLAAAEVAAAGAEAEAEAEVAASEEAAEATTAETSAEEPKAEAAPEAVEAAPEPEVDPAPKAAAETVESAPETAEEKVEAKAPEASAEAPKEAAATDEKKEEEAKGE